MLDAESTRIIHRPCIYNSDEPGTKTVTLRVDNPPQGLGRSLIGWGSWNLRPPGKIWSHLRILGLSILLQLHPIGVEKGDPPGLYRSARCENIKPIG